MPGIVGLITRKPSQFAQAQTTEMLRCIVHEEFYTSGTFSEPQLGIYVGWTAIKGSFSDSGPARSEKGDIHLVFSGEEFSPGSTHRMLKSKGHSFSPDDVSYLVHLYEELGEGFLPALNGMFHGAIVDKRNSTVTLFNDRYGMHRLFFHQTADAFYFASEAKAIAAVCPNVRQPDAKSIGEFVACSCVLEDRTIFKDVFSLPAASAWTFSAGTSPVKGTYFQPQQWESQQPLSEQEYLNDLSESLQTNLPLYFAGREKVGIALTGGLDTRVIMAWHKPAAGTLPCYTFGGVFRDCEDVRLAQRLARMAEQPHQVLRAGGEFLSRFPHYAQRSIYLTEGGVDVYRASDLYLSEEARKIAPAKVVGTYGSEIVRHAVMFKPMPPAPGMYSSDFLKYVDEAKDTYSSIRRQNPVTFAAFRQSPWYHHGILALEQSQLTVRSPFLDNDFVRTVYRAPMEDSSTHDDIRLKLIRAGSPQLAAVRSDRGVGGNSGKIHSAIVRAFLEFTFKAEYAYDYGMPQWVARTDHLFSGLHLEKLFLGRHKLLHFRLWYKTVLAKYVREMLLDSRTLSRGYLHPQRVEAIVRGHLDEGRNYTTEIHKLLTLELLQRQFFDAQ